MKVNLRPEPAEPRKPPITLVIAPDNLLLRARPLIAAASDLLKRIARRIADWRSAATFPHYQQTDAMNCGPTCLRIIARHFGKSLPASEAEAMTHKGKQGVNLMSLCGAAEAIGLRTLPVRCDLATLVKEGRFPFLAHWNQNHFVVVYRISEGRVYVSDPAAPRLVDYSLAEFRRSWASHVDKGKAAGFAVFFETTPVFHTWQASGVETQTPWYHLLGYLHEHRDLAIQLALATGIGCLIAFVSPFLMQSLVDQGIERGDRNFVALVIAAQVCVTIGQTGISLLRGWLLLYLSSRISIALIADFLQMILRLPMRFFESRSTGDLIQRLNDNHRVETFLTSGVLDAAFSGIMILVYAIVIATFSRSILLVFLVGAALNVTYVMRFLAARQRADHRRFNESAISLASEMELIRAVAEIKLTGSEKQKRWAWERVQARLFKIHQDVMKLQQIQQTGSVLIGSATTITANALAAYAVIRGDLTLGAMMALTSMLGQMGASMDHLVGLVQRAQDAALSVKRITEVYHAEPEDDPNRLDGPVPTGDIVVDEVSFRYGDPTSPPVLDRLSFSIPAGRTTAIVGASGSGKTTMLKLLLKFYEPETGEISVGGTSLGGVRAADWRQTCAAVMQDGHVFADTIARNIAVADDDIDREKLVWAAEVANARSFIERLPMSYNTKVGENGVGMSGGQMQRLLIARAIYRQPRLLLLDEATSALDAGSEAIVSRNFALCTEGITKVIIAHRLSTVRDADQIVVLDGGRIAEIGTHRELSAVRGLYFNLVRNQLELGA
jgi:ATP-binding cassette subfamily B protein